MKSLICVLLSGGLDSTTALYWAKNKFKNAEFCAILFDYNQRHKKEIEFAKWHLEKLGIKNYTVKDLSIYGNSSSLVNKDLAIPNKNYDEIGNKIENTYVPLRNTIMLSLAANYTEDLIFSGKVKAEKVILVGGWNLLGYLGYPDCSENYLITMEKALNYGSKLGTEKQGFAIYTPLITKTKKQIIEMGLKLGVDYSKTWSCYAGTETPCLKCDSCKLRIKAFEELGMIDPLLQKEGNQ